MIAITVNGKKHEVEADPQMPLLYVLRDILSMTGTKFGCGAGLCGACTIHLNGTPIRSCITPLSVAKDQTLTTIEGLGSDGKLHPLQQAWVEHSVPQCGYCQAGQIMAAAALLEQNPSPSDKDIETQMQGNICRCGTYPRIKQAIKTAAKQYKEVKA